MVIPTRGSNPVYLIHIITERSQEQKNDTKEPFAKSKPFYNARVDRSTPSTRNCMTQMTMVKSFTRKHVVKTTTGLRRQQVSQVTFWGRESGEKKKVKKIMSFYVDVSRCHQRMCLTILWKCTLQFKCCEYLARQSYECE